MKARGVGVVSRAFLNVDLKNLKMKQNKFELNIKYYNPTVPNFELCHICIRNCKRRLYFIQNMEQEQATPLP